MAEEMWLLQMRVTTGHGFHHADAIKREQIEWENETIAYASRLPTLPQVLDAVKRYEREFERGTKSALMHHLLSVQRIPFVDPIRMEKVWVYFIEDAADQLQEENERDGKGEK